MKIKKKVIIPVALVVVIVAGFVVRSQMVAAQPQVTTVDTYAVEITDLTSTVPVTGMVESDSSTGVYNTLTYPVDTVDVEVGDKVNEGDILAQLDTTALEASIRQNQATVYAAQSKAQQALKLAEKDLETYKRNAEDGYDSKLYSAENSVVTAEMTLQNAELEVVAAADECRNAKRDLEEAKDIGEIDEKLDALRETLRSKELALERAQATRDKAQVALEEAKTDNAAAKVGSGDSISSYEDAIDTAKLGTNFSDQYIAIEKLQNDLEDATIKAPVSGTVTAVYAKEGSSGTGLLFVIEDTSKLKVVTKVKEYDIGTVTEGLPVTIKADATGDAEFAGVVSMISPTTVKDDTGKTVDTTSAEFETEVQVTSGEGLRIGMNARLNIITEEKKGVVTVPFEAIAVDETGATYVMIMVPQEDGTNIAKKVPVTPGMETDFFSEIVESELKEGDLVISNPTGITEGALVTQLDQAAIQQALEAE